MRRDRLAQLGFLAAAAAALAGAAALQRPIESRRVAAGLVIVGAGQPTAKHPKAAVLQVAPGGLRAVLLNYLWIRSQQLKEEGKFFDAQGLRELIGDMMPYFSGVWGFIVWDMAWNISVATHTEPERWMWIHNAIKLARDKGLYYNPKELALYAVLARIFQEKMGQYTDEMHMVYKRRWAEEMDRVLGAPSLTGTTEDAIEAIRRVAAAPGTLQELRADEQARPFLDKLAALEVKPGESFLRYYSRFSPDPLTGTLDPAPKAPGKGTEEKIAELMSSEAFLGARRKVLAFSRRKVLSEQYRMEPGWMVQLMEKYGPMDWRSVNSHAIYWATMGLRRSAGLTLAELQLAAAEAELAVPTQKLDLDEITRLNTERRVLHALKSLTKTGQLYVRRIPDPDKPEETLVELEWLPDWRFIEPTHQEYVASGLALTRDGQQLHDEVNMLRDAHVNFLEDVVVQCFFGARTGSARRYLNEIKTRLKPTTDLYQKEMPLREFVMIRTRRMGVPSTELARIFWQGGLRVAYASLLAGDGNAYGYYHSYAFRSYDVWRRERHYAQRLTPPPFAVIERDFLETLMLRPHVVRMRLSLLRKSQLYNAISDGRRRAIYPAIAGPLQAECHEQGISFEAAFPKPPPPRVPVGPPTRP